MRQFITGLCLSTLTLGLLGCNGFDRWRRKDENPNQIGLVGKPEPDSLVAYLNRNAQKVRGLQCNNVTLQVSQGSQSAVLNSAKLFCEKPRNFRMTAKILASPGVDIGSNSKEFWYWISKADPGDVVFHCNYEALEKGQVRAPFPFHPEMIMAALGIAEYDPRKQYQVKETRDTFELIEDSLSPQGKPVKKVTVFNRRQARRGEPQVIAHILRDEKGTEISKAKILQVQEVSLDGRGMATVPRWVEVTWPGEKVKMKMKLDGLKAVQFSARRSQLIFNRSNLQGNGLRSFNLATGRFDSPTSRVERANHLLP